MKKLIASVLIFSMLTAMSITAFAAEINQDSASKESKAVITTTISPSYTVSIPEDVSVTFNATETMFGSIEVTQAQIEPDKQIVVSLTTDGELINQTDNTKTIPYTVENENGVFTSGTYLAVGDKTDLTINITQEGWDQAAAGSYADTVTFKVSYESIG